MVLLATRSIGCGRWGLPRAVVADLNVSLLFKSESRAVYASDYWGAWAAGNDTLIGDEQTLALQMVPVFAATRLIADSIASLPLQAYRKVGDARMPADLPPLFANPTKFGTTYDWVFRCVTSLTLRGNAFGLITARDTAMYPTQLEWLNPAEVTIQQDDTNFTPVWYWRGRRLDSADLLHIPNYVVPGRVLGVSPIKAYKTVIETGLYAQNFGRDWFQNGNVPSGVVKSPQPMDYDQAQIVKDRFKAAGRRRDIVTLPEGLEYEPITIPAEESQFIATLTASASQVASIYGLPPEYIGGEVGHSSLTYATEEMNEIKLLRRLQPYMSKLESAWFPLMPRPRYVKFNADASIRTDMATRFSAYQIARGIGLNNINELRTNEDLPPIEGGDDYTPLSVKTAPAPGVQGGTR